jgi:ribosomal protein S18 acetylase RimI-like enzyme
MTAAAKSAFPKAALSAMLVAMADPERPPILVRPYVSADAGAVWSLIRPHLRAGETYALPRDWSREQALGYWCGPPHEAFVAEADGGLVGTYYIQPNQKGGGAHVANAGYMTAASAAGRGVARAMCAHSLDHARARGFRAMQFNFVVATNSRAVALWESFGFEIVGTLPGAFDHPRLGFVDAFVMFRTL